MAGVRLLKAVVIVLGVLIVIGLGVLVVGIGLKFGAHRGAPPTDRDPAMFALPPGATIVEMQTQPGRVVLRVRTKAGEEIDIVDTQDGRLVGRVKAPK